MLMMMLMMIMIYFFYLYIYSLIQLWKKNVLNKYMYIPCSSDAVNNSCRQTGIRGFVSAMI